MKSAIKVKPGVTIALDGSKTVTYVREGMTGKGLKRIVEKNKQSFAIARQVLTTVKG
jgi:hypothetical protein